MTNTNMQTIVSMLKQMKSQELKALEYLVYEIRMKLEREEKNELQKYLQD